MRYTVTHHTTYRYSQPVTLGHNLVHLAPRDLALQEVHSRELRIEPMPENIAHFTDYFGNLTAGFTLESSHSEMVVTHRSELSVEPTSPPDVGQSVAWERVRPGLFEDRDDAALDALQFLFDSPLAAASPDLRAYAESSFTSGRPVLEAAADLCHRLYTDFAYDPQATSIATPLAEVMAHRRGVCQDFAHLMIAMLRSLQLPARYLSGYIRTFKNTSNPNAGRLVGADASHAWCEVYEPTMGWVGFDPTNNLIPSDMHITAAWGRDYHDVSPVRGVILGGGDSVIEVDVQVTPSPRDS